MAIPKVDMTGKKYSSVTAIEPVGRCSNRELLWLFVCDCGNKFESAGSDIRKGKIKTCPICSLKTKRKAVTTHGMTDFPEYKIWTAMKRRCYNKKSFRYEDYGGRGIKVCDRWVNSFENFYADMGIRPIGWTIERINNDNNYGPENCRWATRLEQANNKRNNRIITIEGKTKTLSEWSRECSVTVGCIRQRLKRGITGTALVVPSKLIKGVSA